MFELLTPDDAIRGHIQGQAPAGIIKAAAVQSGMTTLQQDGQAKVAAGKTTVDEVLRVTTRAAM